MMSEQVNPMDSKLILKTRDLCKRYAEREVVRQVSIEVARGEVVGLLGPNGAGKTTTFYMITGLVRPTCGEVFFMGQDVTRMPIYRRARLGMGYLPQEESIFRSLTVEENLLAILEFLPLTSKERRTRCEALLERFGLSALKKNLAMTLSGGEKRRLTIARTMVTSPSLILLDEPFSGVDPLAVADIQKIIQELRGQGLGVLITDHNVRETLAVVDRAYLIYEGRVARQGSREFLANDPETRRLYLGEHFRM
ncbi:MAG: LPS export ABC transporter ATP-binding protein [Verrucomicrobiae bacterium]|nr:LPS export ABC transporter ATP-binding protein [Verrucomicrobiae bacterium]